MMNLNKMRGKRARVNNEKYPSQFFSEISPKLICNSFEASSRNERKKRDNPSHYSVRLFFFDVKING